MEIWLDTIDCDAVSDAAKTGVISGVTTNPSILSKADNVSHTLRRLLDIQPGPVAVQVTGQSSEDIIEEARCIFGFSKRALVKIPINRNGLIAIKELKKENIPILGTGVLFPEQALLAATLEISSIAAYFSHMGDFGRACETLKTIVDMFKATKASTKILVASVKQIEHIVYCAHLGVEAITLKADLYHQLVANRPRVEEFSERFLSDWQQAHGKVSIKDALKR